MSPNGSAANQNYTQQQNTDPNSTIPNYQRWSSQDVAESQSWGLTKPEWLKYKEYMAYGQNASYYSTKPEVTPVMILGFMATTEAERKKYAIKYIQTETARQEREIAFDETVNKYIKELTPNHPIWMTEPQRRDLMKRLSGRQESKGSNGLPQITDTRVVIYADAKDCDKSCSTFVKSFLSNSSSLSRVDLFALNAESDESLRAFGVTLGFTTDVIEQGKATLNHDLGYYARLKPTPGLPIAYRVGLSGTTKISP
jgi:integrating conjugative element protein (TIGR03759 family)